MAKIYLTGDYSEDGGTYALQIIADLLISKGHKVTFPAQFGFESHMCPQSSID